MDLISTFQLFQISSTVRSVKIMTNLVKLIILNFARLLASVLTRRRCLKEIWHFVPQFFLFADLASRNIRPIISFSRIP